MRRITCEFAFSPITNHSGVRRVMCSNQQHA